MEPSHAVRSWCSNGGSVQSARSPIQKDALLVRMTPGWPPVVEQRQPLRVLGQSPVANLGKYVASPRTVIPFSSEGRFLPIAQLTPSPKASWPPPLHVQPLSPPSLANFSPPCTADGASVTSCYVGDVVLMLCTTPVFWSTPTCTFITKCHSFPFLSDALSGLALQSAILRQRQA